MSPRYEGKPKAHEPLVVLDQGRVADAVRDDLRSFVAARLGDPGGVLICDETGFLKKGTGSVGVQRQYSGTAGRIENSQVGRVPVSYASPRGRALIDRRVYLPRSWADDQERCTAAGIPADAGFATKPELALEMITGAVAAGTPAAWVASDEAYGDNGAFRAGAAKLGLGYVLAVSCTHRIPACSRELQPWHQRAEPGHGSLRLAGAPEVQIAWLLVGRGQNRGDDGNRDSGRGCPRRIRGGGLVGSRTTTSPRGSRGGTHRALGYERGCDQYRPSCCVHGSSGSNPKDAPGVGDDQRLGRIRRT